MSEHRPEIAQDLALRLLCLVPEHGSGNPADDVVVLGIAERGVPVAVAVARTLGAPLDIVFAHRIAVPWDPARALGAVCGGRRQVFVVNPVAADLLPGLCDHLTGEATRRFAAISAREAVWRADHPPLPLDGRTVIVVDDCAVTGSTLRAVLLTLRHERPHRLIAAVPTATPEALEALAGLADDLLCPEPAAAVPRPAVKLTA